MFAVDKMINSALSDQFIKYRTLRFNGVVRGQLIDIGGSADAIVHALNDALVSGTRSIAKGTTPAVQGPPRRSGPALGC